MITAFSILLILIFLVLVPFVVGLLFEHFFENGERIVFSRCFAMGLALMLALFQLIAVPMIHIGTDFDTLLCVYTALLIATVILSLFLSGKRLTQNVKEAVLGIRDELATVEKLYLIIIAVTIVLIAFQTSLLIFRMHTDTDDCRFLAEALEAIERNTLLRVHVITGEQLMYPIGEMTKEVTAPYPLFISVLAVYTRLHPTVLAHLVLPVLLIPLCYAVLFLIGKTLFEDIRKIAVYMFIASVVILFSFESIYTWGYTLLTIIWQGRSISAVIMLPLLWYILMRVYTEEKLTPALFAALVIVGTANSCLSGMGALIAPIICAAFALAYLVRNKNLLTAILIGVGAIPSGIYAVIKTLL